MGAQHVFVPHALAHGHVVHGVAGAYDGHDPAAQICPGAHTVPQVPQYGSPASRLTHDVRPVMGHPVSPAEHAPVWHDPFSHLSPTAHGVAVHAPQ